MNQHRRRRGAADFFEDSTPVRDLAACVVSGNEARPNWGSQKVLSDHIARLHEEFVGRPVLELRHATLIVLIRRGYKVEDSYSKFMDLWNEGQKFLIQGLNLRWLVSAADTIADHDPDPLQRALALTASSIVNTAKMYESERFLCDTQKSEFDPVRCQQVKGELVPLPGGMSVFTVGTDDTLRNLRWRLDSFQKTGIAGAILARCFGQMQECDTAFQRFRNVHTREKNAWWD